MMTFILGVVIFGILAVVLLVMSCFWAVLKLAAKVLGGVVIGAAVVWVLVKVVMVSLYVVVAVLGIAGVVALCRRRLG